MNSLLEQFISETREFLQSIGERLLQLEREPDNVEYMTELFRLVHTLKGNSGLFDFPEMNRVLHAGEDLMDAVRDGRVAYSRALADRLLDMVDFVGTLTDEVEIEGALSAKYGSDSATLAGLLRGLIKSDSGAAKPSHSEETAAVTSDATAANEPVGSHYFSVAREKLLLLPESLRMALFSEAMHGKSLYWVEYTPEADCFFKGEDPFFLARQTPEVRWQKVASCRDWAPLAELDAYAANLAICMLNTASVETLNQHFRYVLDQVVIAPVSAIELVLPDGTQTSIQAPPQAPLQATPQEHGDYIKAALESLEESDTEQLLTLSNAFVALAAPDKWETSVVRWIRFLLEHKLGDRHILGQLLIALDSNKTPDWQKISAAESVAEKASYSPLRDQISMQRCLLSNAFSEVICAQRAVLAQSNQHAWLPGRLKSVAASLNASFRVNKMEHVLEDLDSALQQALAEHSSSPLLAWLDKSVPFSEQVIDGPVVAAAKPAPIDASLSKTPAQPTDPEPKFGRREEDNPANLKTLKVEQVKIDRLMNLIGEIVVAKNSLPYLASRAENQYGVREMGREIKAQYAIINRIAEEMQDAIMQVRMMPVSFIFQRFPRLVRDLSRKLGKQVNLVLEGEETEVDKNIVEALADPLIHILRNSLDHGLELPEVRKANNKPAAGRLTIRANQVSDRVVIEISDDGKGIDPAIIKVKAYQKGIIDEATLERITDQDAINLVFAAGFSTVDEISDLSGRGVGMDVVRNAIEKVHGAIHLKSDVGVGTVITLSLPLSMAISNVMIIESHKQNFGIPMDAVVETVRVPKASIRTIKNSKTTVLRNRIVPLLDLNQLLAVNAQQCTNDEDEIAVLVVRHEGEHVGIVVDDFHESIDIILKPMTGMLANLSAYAGSALLGDGSVLMVLNPRELL